MGKPTLCSKRALDITERTLGKTHPTIVICLLDLSKLHYLRGDLERARSELEQALPIAQKTLEPDDRILIFVVHNLGLYYSLLGDIQHAEPLLERALTAIELKYGARASLRMQSSGKPRRHRASEEAICTCARVSSRARRP